jgi:dihydroxyacid dehydratase/phosphogluconate dehydratase
MEIVASSAPSVGYCNTMGTATTMNSLAEALGMQLAGFGRDPGALPRTRADLLRDRESASWTWCTRT